MRLSQGGSTRLFTLYPMADRENAYSGMGEAIGNIARAISTLPRPVRRVCYVQVCAFMGWFPFLFYR